MVLFEYIPIIGIESWIGIMDVVICHVKALMHNNAKEKGIFMVLKYFDACDVNSIEWQYYLLVMIW